MSTELAMSGDELYEEAHCWAIVIYLIQLYFAISVHCVTLRNIAHSTAMALKNLFDIYYLGHFIWNFFLDRTFVILKVS